MRITHPVTSLSFPCAQYVADHADFFFCLICILRPATRVTIQMASNARCSSCTLSVIMAPSSAKKSVPTLSFLPSTLAPAHALSTAPAISASSGLLLVGDAPHPCPSPFRISTGSVSPYAVSYLPVSPFSAVPSFLSFPSLSALTTSVTSSGTPCHRSASHCTACTTDMK